MKLAIDCLTKAMPLELSAVSELLSNPSTKSPRESLAIEILHNLQHQHGWTDLKLFTVSSASSSTSTPTSSPSRSRARSKSPARTITFLISGLPPKHSYIHPDLRKWMIKHNIQDNQLSIQREWVLPLSLGEKWTLKQFCWTFDGLSERDVINVSATDGENLRWKDSKRVLLAMLAHNGMGGDGTVTYYIMQEGDVKPRQNG